MFCTNCGKEIPDGAKFCGNCGWKVPENTENNTVQKSHSEQSMLENKQIDDTGNNSENNRVKEIINASNKFKGWVKPVSILISVIFAVLLFIMLYFNHVIGNIINIFEINLSPIVEMVICIILVPLESLGFYGIIRDELILKHKDKFTQWFIR
jgi:predicted nucleic acid-binding Zn ribbon protein